MAALVFVSLLLRYDISLRTLEAWAVACLLLACAFADLEGYIIPDRFIAVGVVLFIVTLFFVPDPGKRALDGLIGGVAVGGGVLLLALLMEKLLRRDAMGGGDIKLLFLTGLFLGWQKKSAVPAAGLRRRHPMGPCPRQARTAGPSLYPASRWPPGAPPCSARTLSTGIFPCCGSPISKKARYSVLKKIVGIDIGGSSVKLAYFAGSTLKKGRHGPPAGQHGG